jgi:hypothetical protein
MGDGRCCPTELRASARQFDLFWLALEELLAVAHDGRRDEASLPGDYALTMRLQFIAFVAMADGGLIAAEHLHAVWKALRSENGFCAGVGLEVRAWWGGSKRLGDGRGRR